MKKVKYILFLFIISGKLLAQNLVPNWSFEDSTHCPYNGEIDFALPWYSPTAGTPDYYYQCNTWSLFEIPSNIHGFQYAKTGIAYAGIGCYGSDISTNIPAREYLQIKLSDSLLMNKSYCVSFYLSLADGPLAYKHVAITEIGLFFSTIPITSTNLLPLQFTPQLTSSPGIYLSDTSQWMKVSGIYAALGGEKYITIGNFKDDISTDMVVLYNNGQDDPQAYYYIDDISVNEIKNADAGRDTTICGGESIQIGSSNYDGITYSWQPTNGLSNANSGKPIASPTQTTTYYLTQTTACNISTDTVTVTVCEYNIRVPNIFTPNNDGVNDSFKITTKNITRLNCKIYNRWGILVSELTKTNEVWDGLTTSGLQCENGVYYYLLAATGEDGKEYDEKGFVSLVR